MADEAAIDATQEAVPAEGVEPTPPWGSEADFDPAKAWNLIQNLRGDVEKAKARGAEADDLQAKIREYEDAKLSDQERADRDLEDQRTAAANLASENALLKAVIAHPELTADDIELLHGIPSEAVEERAAKLAARLGAGTPQKPLTNRPSEALRGGADPTKPATSGGTDWLRSALARSAD